MSIYPGAVFKPTPHGGKVKRNRQGRGVLHVAVSNARALPPWNANTWHFYVAKDGYCEQYVDTDFRAYAAADANDDAILIETAGGLGSSKVLNAEAWTPAQIERLADIAAWESKQPGGAPLELLPDARPGRRGWGPHRLGIKHSGGARPGWWQPGCEVWSSVLGKECPGDTKVSQIPQIIARARQIASGAPIQQEDDMLPDERQWLADIRHTLTGGAAGLKEAGQIWAAVTGAHTQAVALRGEIAGLKTALQQLASAPGQAVDLGAVQSAARAGAQEALVQGVDIDVTVGGQRPDTV